MNTLRYFDFGAARPVLLLIARIAVVLIFIIFGFPKIMGLTVRSNISPRWARQCRCWQRLGGSGSARRDINRAWLFDRPLAVLFIFYTLGTAVIGHHYWDMTGDAVGPNMINFWKNVSIAGAFLLLAITGPGAILLKWHFGKMPDAA